MTVSFDYGAKRKWRRWVWEQVGKRLRYRGHDPRHALVDMIGRKPE